MSQSEPDIELKEAFADAGRALAGEEPTDRGDAISKADVPEPFRDLVDSINDLDERVAERERARERKRQAVADLIERVEALDAKLTEIERSL